MRATSTLASVTVVTPVTGALFSVPPIVTVTFAAARDAATGAGDAATGAGEAAAGAGVSAGCA